MAALAVSGGVLGDRKPIRGNRKYPTLSVPTVTDEDYPDLLSSAPTRRLDPRRTREALTFAFAQGIADDTWDELLQRASLPETKWDAEGFAPDLFVREPVAANRTITIDGARHLLGQKWLERVLSHPPADQAHAWPSSSAGSSPSSQLWSIMSTRPWTCCALRQAGANPRAS